MSPAARSTTTGSSRSWTRARFSDADALLSQPAARAALDDADWTSLSVAVVQRLAQAEVDNGGNLAAAGVVADALKRMGGSPRSCRPTRPTCTTRLPCCTTRASTRTQRPSIDQGLAVYPDSRMLQQDLDLARKAMRDNRS